MPNALTIDLEIEIEAPPEKVWEVFSSAERMHAWMSMQGYHPKVGSEYVMRVNAPDGVFDFIGEVTVFDPPNELAFTWIQQEVGKQPWPVSTLVSIQLQPIDSGTHVRLVHSGFEALAAEIAQQEYEGHIMGWEQSQALAELKQLVESQN
ncbi:MAG: SRPBCC domain-containing protein [Chloroflexota bacterium]